jgi:hypothetical protein
LRVIKIADRRLTRNRFNKMERVTKRATTATTKVNSVSHLLRPVPSDAPADTGEAEPHWCHWRSVAKGVLRSTPRDRQHDAIGYALELSPALCRAATERVNEAEWRQRASEIFYRFVGLNILEPLPCHVSRFMWGLWNETYSASFAWTLHDDEADVVACLDLAHQPNYKPYMLDTVLASMNLDIEDNVTSEEVLLFLQTRVFPWCPDKRSRKVFTAWHTNLELEGVFDRETTPPVK